MPGCPMRVIPVCIGGEFESGGTCLPKPSGDDCTGEATCQGAYYCGCIALCPTCGDCAEFQMGACT